ncbi:MAG: serine protease [Candidatus Nealsonbacteria bacterium]|nr:MAG: serine protease [Candidatus Nealsonbacteria bacterium]
MLKNIFKIISIFIIGIVGGIFADQILWPYFIERPFFHQYRLEQSPVYVTERKEITIQENVALKNAIEKVEKVVVGVRTETKAGKFLEGSGLIITADGLMVTLAKLVPQGSTFSFFIDGEKVNFQILKRDLEDNLVLVKIEEENLPTVSFADLEKMKLGERVFLVGVIFEKEEPSKIVNEGIVKSFDQDFIKTNIFEENILKGSPLFDIEGNILGLNTIDLEGKIVAISISKVKSFAGF